MSSAQVDDVILRLSGIEKKRDKQKEIIQICPRCKVKNTPSNFCSACAFPLNNEAAAKALEKKQAVESFLDMAVQKYPGVLEMLEKIAQKETIKMEV